MSTTVLKSHANRNRRAVFQNCEGESLERCQLKHAIIDLDEAITRTQWADSFNLTKTAMATQEREAPSHRHLIPEFQRLGAKLSGHRRRPRRLKQPSTVASVKSFRGLLLGDLAGGEDGDGDELGEKGGGYVKTLSCQLGMKKQLLFLPKGNNSS